MPTRAWLAVNIQPISENNVWDALIWSRPYTFIFLTILNIIINIIMPSDKRANSRERPRKLIVYSQSSILKILKLIFNIIILKMNWAHNALIFWYSSALALLIHSQLPPVFLLKAISFMASFNLPIFLIMLVSSSFFYCPCTL